MNTPTESLPVDTIVLTYGYGASPVRAVILAPQRADGSYSVGRECDTSATSRISPEDIVDVIDENHHQRAIARAGIATEAIGRDVARKYAKEMVNEMTLLVIAYLDANEETFSPEEQTAIARNAFYFAVRQLRQSMAV